MPNDHDYEIWFRGKVVEALNDKRPDVSHEEARRLMHEKFLKSIPIRENIEEYD